MPQGQCRRLTKKYKLMLRLSIGCLGTATRRVVPRYKCTDEREWHDNIQDEARLQRLGALAGQATEVTLNLSLVALQDKDSG